MSVKIQKQIQYLFMVSISLWAVSVITPPPRLNNRSLLRQHGNQETLSKIVYETSAEETIEKKSGGSLKGVKTWLRTIFHQRNKTPVEYHTITGTTEKRNMLPGAAVSSGIPVGDQDGLTSSSSGILRLLRSYSRTRIHKVNLTDPRIHFENDNRTHQYVDEKREESIGPRLHHYLTHPTTTCQRLVRVGGRSCVGAFDGTKLVCMDDDVRPRPANCLVYSFGVGNDFTFDRNMQDYGCEVHSFDHDDDHELYDYRQGPSFFFHKARIGVKTGYFKTCELTQYGLECQPSLRYHTMADIRRMLGHNSRNLDYFKMDIEGAEWMILKDVIQNSTIFNYTKQIALEIHLDHLRFEKTEDRKRTALYNYFDVFLSLKKLGFRVAAYEENEMNPRYEKADGVTMNIYAEVLLLKKNR